MTAYFLDNSAMPKRYIFETGTGWMLQRTDPTSEEVLFVAQITPVEVISGRARKTREGYIASETMLQLRDLIASHMTAEYSVVILNGTIFNRAEDLLLTYPLRAYDAVQLASMLDVVARIAAVGLDSPVFVSADRRLLVAAEAEGLIIDDPNQHA